MKFTLNPYALVIEADGATNFILSDYANPIKIVLNAKQSEVLSEMNKQAFYDYDELSKVFGETFVNTLVQNGCFVPAVLDTVSSHSRSNAFFATHNMPEARNRLNQAKVLVLGAGGIGTHMAWHMVALGVAKLTIVDFDTVEVSNFNRQLLFDRSDVGKVKVEVLKDKLSEINPDVQIETKCTRISSQSELEEICLADNYNLIIKALDSPAEFPLWLDHVAQKHSLTYISGITMRENVLIGPSYIPGDDACGWSELMKLDFNNSKKVYGTAPSLGIMLYHISDELAMEAFKILTGYGSLKYEGKILCKNIFTNQERVFEKVQSKNKSEKEVQGSGKVVLMNMLLMVVLAVASFSQPWFLIGGALLAMILPFVMYRTNQDIMKVTFLNSTILSVGLVVMMLQWVSLETVTSLISSLVLLFGVHSATTLLMCTLNFVISKFVRKH
ncbi:MAG: hypothetical protein E7582_07745 [Ruminococcaceae bacterium]|nr:hypothetical protein [Oscillospiraceae bacterium]